MGVGQAIADLRQQLQDLQGRQALLQEGLGEILPGHVFHGHVGDPGGFAAFVDGDQIGVVEPLRGLGFPEEAIPGFLGGEGGRLDGLEGHFAADDGVPGQEDRAHGAFSKGLDHFEFTDTGKAFGHDVFPGDAKPQDTLAFRPVRRRENARGPALLG